MIFNKVKLNNILKTLYPINRSITGEGYRKSLEIIKKEIPLKNINYRTGQKVYDWTIPLEWKINDAYIITPKGKKIADLKKHNLHVLNYSTPIKKKIKYSDLIKHIYTIPHSPNAIPYVHSYYQPKWGFAMKHKEFKSLPKKGDYFVNIESKLFKGKLVNADLVLKGESNKEIMFSTYLCHPQMANHELSGPLMLTLIYKYLKTLKKRKYTYRFLICPENIGSIAYLKSHGKILQKKLVGGFILNCLAHGKIFTYKKTRQGNSLVDKIVLNVLKHLNSPYKLVDFFPDGADERQFSSPGFNLPFGLLMRKMYDNMAIPEDFPEYHTSLDDLNFFDMSVFEETYNTYIKIIDTLEFNFVPKARVLYGTPQLSKLKTDIYPSMMNFAANPRKEYISILLEILNLSEGKIDLIDIAEKKQFSLIDYKELIKKMINLKLIKKF